MRIGQLAKATSTKIETLRYYERAGLLPPPARQKNGYRAYSADAMAGVNFIRHCRTLDIGLADVKRLLDFTVRPKADCSDVNRLLDVHLIRVRAKLKSLKALEKQLAILRAQCDNGRRVANCGILQEMVAAAHGEASACGFCRLTAANVDAKKMTA